MSTTTGSPVENHPEEATTANQVLFPTPVQQHRFQYVVKFVCGKSCGENGIVARGKYFTAINIHNPGGRNVKFRKRFAVALPGQAGAVTKLFAAVLGPYAALEIDCPEIARLTRTTPGCFLKGFAIIESPVELDVVAVYTAAGKTKHIETLHMERIRPRVLTTGGPDLVPELDPNCPQRMLVITIRNQGTANAPATTTMVEFLPNGAYPGDSVPLPTAPVPAGGFVTLTVEIPPDCLYFAGIATDCKFRVTADYYGAVTETEEGNNVVEGLCPHVQ